MTEKKGIPLQSIPRTTDPLDSLRDPSRCNIATPDRSVPTFTSKDTEPSCGVWATNHSGGNNAVQLQCGDGDDVEHARMEVQRYVGQSIDRRIPSVRECQRSYLSRLLRAGLRVLARPEVVKGRDRLGIANDPRVLIFGHSFKMFTV